MKVIDNCAVKTGDKMNQCKHRWNREFNEKWETGTLMILSEQAYLMISSGKSPGPVTLMARDVVPGDGYNGKRVSLLSITSH